MIYSIFESKGGVLGGIARDTTIYEGAASKINLDTEFMNTGIDEILTLEKIISSSKTPLTYNSRILLDFEIDWTKISNNTPWSSSKAYLNLYTAEAKRIGAYFEVTAHPVSESWISGLGRYGNKPKTLEGASWKNYSGKGTAGNRWTTGSFTSQGTGSNLNETGGGTWYTASFGYQEIYEGLTTDLRMDVTNILTDWSSSVYYNEGFIIKKSGSAEYTASDYEKNDVDYGDLKYFSSNTHTVYPPRLEICWDDKVYNTGSLSALDMSDTGGVFFYLKNNRGSYKRGSKVRLYTLGREKYPVKTFFTTSAELSIKHISSDKDICYSIIDVKTDETIIPHDRIYTALSCHATKGNYFEFYSDSLFEDRHYKIQLRYADSGSTDYSYYNIKDTFKVTR
jgi:hypothetical protein